MSLREFDTRTTARYTGASTFDGDGMRSLSYILVGSLLTIALVGCGPRTQSGNNGEDERFAPLCAPCDTHDACGGEEDYCLQNQGTGEAFCGVACESEGDCPDAYVCTEVGMTGIKQCAPMEATCAGLRDPCNGDCTSGEVCVQESCVATEDWSDEQQICVDYINELRASVDADAVVRSESLEECATVAAIEDSRTGDPHGHFIRTNGCGYQAYAENEVPGWSLSRYGSVASVVRESADAMFAEGPGGGHYEIITGDYDEVGCGIHVTDEDAVWVVHNFR